MISIILPVYNGEDYILESIQSLLSQTEKNFELIIVNDGSIDRTESIIQTFNDPRIRYVKKENGGTSSALNVGLDLAQGEYIAWQAADDLSLPIRLEMCKRQFTHTDIGIVHTDMLLIANNSPISYWQGRNIDPSRLLRFFLKIGTPYNGGSMMIRKEAIGNMRFNSKYKIGEDTDFISRLSPEWRSIHIPEPYYIYRKHNSNSTNTSDYQRIYEHMQDFLSSNHLSELVPELPWDTEPTESNNAKAMAIIAVFLFRRGMTLDGEVFYNKAVKLSSFNDDTLKFVKGMGQIILGKMREAYESFLQCSSKDAVINNYLGETLSFLGEHRLAMSHFLSALNQNPYYEEPIDNLRALGANRQYNMLDSSWNKFN